MYIDLSEQLSVESREISEGVVVDYDVNGNLVGIDIDNASKKVELQQLILNISSRPRYKPLPPNRVSGGCLAATNTFFCLVLEIALGKIRRRQQAEAR